MNENWTDRLSEYLDDEMSSEERSACEQRLASDAELRRCLEELIAVRDAARDQPDYTAPEDIWQAVSARIGTETRQRTLMFTIPQFAAAAAILLLLGVGVARLAVVSRIGGGGDVGADVRATVDPVSADVEPRFATTGDRDNYSLFVEDLEQRLEAGRGVLDAETVQVLEQSLGKIDFAIEQARYALEQDPNSTYLNQHLASARARKLRLLEDATALVAART